MKDECYEFLKNEVGKVDIVGFGSYGEVKLARNTENGGVVAIKMIYNKNAKQEIDVHHKLNHPNIIKLINYYYQKEKNVTYMVLEYASGGSLNEKIKFGYGQLNKQLVKRYFRDICSAVQYLHENNFMHRDIKPENILITEDNHAKLCDFGFASILEYRSTLCGTFQYMAPEMIQKKPYDYKIDIWALGILLFELIQGFAPFRGETGEQVITEMKKPLVFSSRFDQTEIDLIKKILRVNSQNRPQISKILDHPYFKDSETPEISKEIKQAGERLRENRSTKNIKDLKEEVPIKQLKDIKIDNPQSKKKQGERKFDFFHRKAELKKEENGDKHQKKDLFKQHALKEQLKKEEIKKQQKKEEPKREEGKWQFKPYVPPNMQNNPANKIIKNPNIKPMPGSFMPVSPNGYQPHPQHAQFNSSMQVPPTYQQAGFPNPYAQNPNASMSTNSVKYIPTPVVMQPQPTVNNFVSPPSFIKTGTHGFMVDPRSPNHQSFNNNNMNIGSTLQMPQQFQGGYNWRKG